MTGFDGPITIARAVAIASSTSGVGGAAPGAAEVDVVDRPLRRGP